MKRWLAALLLCAGVAQAQERVLDDLSDPSAWQVVATDDVRASLRPVAGRDGAGLCLDFDFGRVTGFVAMRRTLPIEWPAHYDVALDLRGRMPRNALQVKFIDASGDNVWWVNRPEYQPPADWRTLRLRQRHVEFAWGPATDRLLRQTRTVEIVVASGSGAGQGEVCIDRLALRTLPAPPAQPPVPVVRGSSSTVPPGLASAVDAAPQPRGDVAAPAWEPRDRAPSLVVDHRSPVEFSALAVRFRRDAVASSYEIETSDDGRRWQPLRRVAGGRGALQAHWLGETEARYVRLRFAPGQRFALEALELQLPASPNAFFTSLGPRAPRGHYPRAYAGEQSYWTVFGVEGARTASLLSEDGVVEPVPGVGAVEPMLVDAGRVLTWADAQIAHDLVDGELPMPRSTWTAGSWRLAVSAFGDGTPEAAQAVVRYRVTNLGATRRSVTLALAWRPFQANPPQQFLSNPGGAAPVDTLSWTGRALEVDGVPRLLPLQLPGAVRAFPLAAGPAPAWAADVAAPGASQGAVSITDPARFPSAVLGFPLDLAPGATAEVAIALPTAGTPRTPSSIEDVGERERAAARRWRDRLGGVTLKGNREVTEIAHTLRAALGHILVNRSGRAVQPGARAYARSWIRDGAMTSAALLRMGRDDVARDFLRWYAPFQFRNGKIPCCATERGADPVPENDADGEFAFAAADLWHHTHDRALALQLWPHVKAAVAHMETLRQSQRTNDNQGDRAGYFGMMPPSISHEGYSDKPAYAYWDNFWAWTGWRSAVELAEGLGLTEEADRLRSQRDEFHRDLLASIAATERRHGLGVLAGAADRGDFDPTSSTIALSPGGLWGATPGAIDERLLRATFDRYWKNFLERRDGPPTWDAYTPYEWRNVGALLRLGQRERALEALRFFFNDRRPAGWRQWAEVVLRRDREPRFLGDMPHGWVASDHIRSVLDLFAYEHEGERSLVLAAGVPLPWFDGDGLAIDGLRTPYGPLAWSGRRVGGAIELTVGALRDPPPGGLWLRGPWPVGARVSIDGQPVAGSGDLVRLPSTGARVRVEL